MFIFKIKDNVAAIDISVTRALLALSGIIVLLYRSDTNFTINIIVAFLLFTAALFINMLLLKLRVDRLLLMSVAAVLFFIATHSVGFVIVLLLYVVAIKFLYKQPTVEISIAGAALTRMIGNSTYEWSNFANIVLKDNLLTLDFKNNKLLQLDIDGTVLAADEEIFNNFCRDCLKPVISDK